MSKKFNYSNYIMSDYDKQRDRLKYEQEKLLRESSPKHIRSEQNRSLIKKMTFTNSKIAQVKLESFNEMSKDLLGYIQLDLQSLTDLTEKEQAAEIMNFYKRNFLDLEELSNGTDQNSHYNEPYDKFFIELIKLNPYFVCYARRETYELSNLPFGKILYQDRIEVLLPRLQSLGMFENEKFIKRYGKLFATKTSNNNV